MVRGLRGLQPPAGLVAVDPGHHDVEQDQVRLAVRRHRERLLAVGGRKRAVAGATELLLEQVDVQRLVVDDQHRAPSAAKVPRDKKQRFMRLSGGSAAAASA